MINNLTYNPKYDNIFDFSFMENFTTVILAKEEYNIDISALKHHDEDDFYCFSENKVYTNSELFEKFNIKKLSNELHRK